MSMEELRSFCRIPDSISLEVSDDPVVSTIGEADNAVYFYPGADCDWTSLPGVVIGETVSTCFLGTSCAYPSERYLDSYGLQCAQPYVPTGHLLGGDLLCLYTEARD